MPDLFKLFPARLLLGCLAGFFLNPACTQAGNRIGWDLEVLNVGYGLETPGNCEFSHFAEHLIGHSLAANSHVTRTDARTGPYSVEFSQQLTRASPPSLEHLVMDARKLSEQAVAFELRMMNVEKSLLKFPDSKSEKIYAAKEALRGLNGCGIGSRKSLEIADADQALTYILNQANGHMPLPLQTRTHILLGKRQSAQEQLGPIVAVAHQVSNGSRSEFSRQKADMHEALRMVFPSAEIAIFEFAPVSFALALELEPNRIYSLSGIRNGLMKSLEKSSSFIGQDDASWEISTSTLSFSPQPRDFVAEARCTLLPKHFLTGKSRSDLNYQVTHWFRFKRLLAFRAYVKGQEACVVGFLGGPKALKNEIDLMSKVY